MTVSLFFACLFNRWMPYLLILTSGSYFLMVIVSDLFFFLIVDCMANNLLVCIEHIRDYREALHSVVFI